MTFDLRDTAFVSGKTEGEGLPDLAAKATAAHDLLEIPENFGTY